MTSIRRTADPLSWLLFSAGGVVSALFYPVTIFLTAVAVPAGWLSEESLFDLIQNPLVRFYLFVLISLPLFHWAHRFRYALIDLGFGWLGRQKILFYGTALAGTLLAGGLLLRL